MKIAGRRLDLAEVGEALLTLPGVRCACVLPHPQRPDALAAVIACDRTGAEPGTRPAPWKIPAHTIPLAELPVTERGKTDRKAVESLLRAAPRE